MIVAFGQAYLHIWSLLCCINSTQLLIGTTIMEITFSNTVKGWLQSFKIRAGNYYTCAFENGQSFTIRSLDIKNDLAVLHEWVNAPHAIAYWQMNGSTSMLREVYEKMNETEYAHSFIGCLDGLPVCQVDAYAPNDDVLGKHYTFTDNDIGIHMLLGERNLSIHNLSTQILAAFMQWIFDANEINRIVAEPDHQNRAANWLLRRSHFEYLGRLDLPEKTACLYSITREGFRIINICKP